MKFTVSLPVYVDLLPLYKKKTSFPVLEDTAVALPEVNLLTKKFLKDQTINLHSLLPIL